jgi:hypothetical protein
MKTKLFLVSLTLLISGVNVEAQILKKLKKKVEQTTEKVILKKTEEKTEQVVDESIDEVINPENDNNLGNSSNTNTSTKDYNQAKLINTDAKRSFYTSDVVIKTSDSNGKGSEYYFDSDEIAARGMAPDNDKPIFIDSEGYQYGYNDSSNRWEKTGLMRSDAMAFMMPMASIGILKLPVEPTLEASEKFKEQGLNLNTFQIVEWAFIYKPEHFQNDDYEQTTTPCPNGGNCLKFLYKDPAYKGSWVMFDNKNRLSEIYAKVNSQQAQGDGSYKFEYIPVNVSIPEAVEVKMPFQDLYMRGLDATPNDSKSEKKISRNTGNNTSASDPANSPLSSDPNERIATIDPNNPLSFPGVTAIVKAQGKTINFLLNTETMALKIDLNDPKMEPIYFDKDNFMYMENGDGCIKAKIDFNQAFSQLEEGMKGKDMPGNMDMEKMKAQYYRDNFGMELAPENVPPVAGWPYVYKPEILDTQDNFEKTSINCEGGNCKKYIWKEGKEKGTYVLFDKYDRLKEIYSTEGKGGKVIYTYPSHRNLRIPEFKDCQYIDMNKDVLGRMFGG